MNNTVAPWEKRCNYLSSPKFIDAIERYLAYRLAHGLGTTVKRAEYRGFHRDPTAYFEPNRLPLFAQQERGEQMTMAMLSTTGLRTRSEPM